MVYALDLQEHPSVSAVSRIEGFKALFVKEQKDLKLTISGTWLVKTGKKWKQEELALTEVSLTEEGLFEYKKKGIGKFRPTQSFIYKQLPANNGSQTMLIISTE